MESLLNLTKRLKNELMNATRDNYKSERWMSDEDIHRIRKGIKEISIEGEKIPGFNFLDTCFGFVSIFEYFYFSNEAEYNEYYNVTETINSIFDPLLIYFMDTDYEVSIRKISISEAIDVIYPNLIFSINAMEQAYHSSDFERVTSLSSTILQSVFKEICALNNIKISTNEQFPKLFYKVKEVLKLDARIYGEEYPKLREFSSHINTIVIKLNEIRNLYSESHGKDQDDAFHYEKLKRHHIKLIVDSTKTIVNFLIDSYDFQFNSLSI